MGRQILEPMTIGGVETSKHLNFETRYYVPTDGWTDGPMDGWTLSHIELLLKLEIAFGENTKFDTPNRG
jgi:hypothetical protein